MKGEWREVAMGRGIKALVVLNLQSYAGGRDLWGLRDPARDAAKGWQTPIFNDGLIEVRPPETIFGWGQYGVRRHWGQQYISQAHGRSCAVSMAVVLSHAPMFVRCILMLLSYTFGWCTRSSVEACRSTKK